jgi:predicted membrane protein
MNPPDQPPRPELVHAWERRLDAELRRLPEVNAPATLVPGVLAIVRAREAMRERAWWRRPATTWHPALRVAFGAAALSLLGAIILGGHLLWPELQASPEARSVSAFGSKLAALWSVAQTVVDALGLVLQSILTPARLAILAAVILSQAALLSAGAAALRATLRPRTSAPA